MSERGGLRQRIARLDWRGSLMALVAILGAGVLTALVINQYQADGVRDTALQQQSQSYEVMILAQSFGGTMAEAEATLARYVVSGEQSVGRDYAAEWGVAAGQLDLLGRRTRDNPAHRRRIAKLRTAFAARSDELAQVAQNTGAGRHAAAYAFFDAARKSPALREIEQLRGSLFDSERTLLAQRTARARRATEAAASETGNLIIFGTLIAIGATVLGWLNVNAIRARAAAAAEATAQRERAIELEAAIVEATADLQAEVRERAAAEAQLRQAQKMEAVGQLTGGIAHDFNNMLAVVLGGLELARRHLPGGALLSARHIDNATEGAQRAAALTRRLLAFARSESLAPEIVEPAELVTGMSNLLERTLGEGIAIVARTDATGWCVWADRHQLENALLNLAVNARDAMNGRGTLTLATGHVEVGADGAALESDDAECAPGNYVTFAVSDTGCGMTKEVAERVFEPFFTTKPVGKGTGLGLSQIFGFVRQSGGEIGVVTAPGEGSTFTLHLPRHIGEVTAGEGVEAPLDDAVPARALDILVVEDDPRVLGATLGALTELGHRPVGCGDPLLAPGIIDRLEALDLIVSDVLMPGQTGPEMIVSLAHRI
ncbi:MAG: ATP-binding protein, partial [Sphingomonas sp.]